MRTTTRTRILATAAATTAAAAAVVVPAPSAAAAGCEFPTYQYVVTGETVTLRTGTGPLASSTTLHAGDVLNTGIRPDVSGWIYGRAYTAARQPIGEGEVLRHWMTYSGHTWCG